jgi:predicted nucleic acid-binding protein
MGLIEALGDGPVGVDSVAFIYFIEMHPRFHPVVKPLFREADRGRRLVTSALTLLEVLVLPLRHGNAALAARYERLLAASENVSMVDVTRAQLRASAGLRGAVKIRTPDALQVTAALTSGCKTFVTNDRRLPSIPGLRVLQLSDYA